MIPYHQYGYGVEMADVRDLGKSRGTSSACTVEDDVLMHITVGHENMRA